MTFTSVEVDGDAAAADDGLAVVALVDRGRAVAVRSIAIPVISPSNRAHARNEATPARASEATSKLSWPREQCPRIRVGRLGPPDPPSLRRMRSAELLPSQPVVEAEVGDARLRAARFKFLTRCGSAPRWSVGWLACDEPVHAAIASELVAGRRYATASAVRARPRPAPGPECDHRERQSDVHATERRQDKRDRGQGELRHLPAAPPPLHTTAPAAGRAAGATVSRRDPRPRPHRDLVGREPPTRCGGLLRPGRTRRCRRRRPRPARPGQRARGPYQAGAPGEAVDPRTIAPPARRREDPPFPSEAPPRYRRPAAEARTRDTLLVRGRPVREQPRAVCPPGAVVWRSRWVLGRGARRFRP